MIWNKVPIFGIMFQICHLRIEMCCYGHYSKATLREFIVRYPESESALEYWYALTKEASWKNFSALKRTFNSVDAVDAARVTFKK
jgi:hypothetical protein